MVEAAPWCISGTLDSFLRQTGTSPAPQHPLPQPWALSTLIQQLCLALAPHYSKRGREEYCRQGDNKGTMTCLQSQSPESWHREELWRAGTCREEAGLEEKVQKSWAACCPDVHLAEHSPVSYQGYCSGISNCAHIASTFISSQGLPTCTAASS